MAAFKNLQMNPPITGRDARTVEPARDLTPLCKQLWDFALPLRGTPGQLYQERRGIGHSRAGRFAPGAITYEGGRKLRLPALILPMTEGRELRALLRIFIDRDGTKSSRLEEPKRTLGDPRGSVVQLGAPASDTMNLAEGFEDAESAIVLNSLSGCAAVCGVERYASIFIPEHVRRVVIYSQHGKAAADAIERGSDNLTANGRSLEIVSPPSRCDWNDALMAKLKARA
ncbi:toprim domain-containing protein [Novosphingobium sp. YJ-S2-02]|uniref:Toprim domain-containing protein n=2 Tax=Novosphingobium aureum TaxID=2792964 RepID=A0A931HGM9_9SPHN|nr:toprim domain-containing protein [Novosphingobium aureum]